MLILALALCAVPASAGDLSPGKLIELANQSRAKENLTALTENPALKAAAKAKAEDMLKNDYFAHTSPKGVAPWHWIKQAGYGYTFAGENLAINFTSAKDQHAAWMKSKTHRANILNGRYTEIGIAVVEGKIAGKNAVITVQFFGTPAVAAAPKPASAIPAREAVPVPVEPATVQGMETLEGAEGPATAQPAMPSEPLLTPQPSSSSGAPALPYWQDVLWMTSMLLIQLMLILAPASLLWRAAQALVRVSKAVQEPFQQLFEHQPVHAHVLHGRGSHL